MHKLVIYTVRAEKLGIPDKEVQGEFEFETVEQAELRALLWLLYCPNDIVMYHEIETDVCRHCGQMIKEKAGWVIHRWVHDGGAYACLPAGETKAEPKEEE